MIPRYICSFSKFHRKSHLFFKVLTLPKNELVTLKQSSRFYSKIASTKLNGKSVFTPFSAPKCFMLAGTGLSFVYFASKYHKIHASTEGSSQDHQAVSDSSKINEKDEKVEEKLQEHSSLSESSLQNGNKEPQKQNEIVSSKPCLAICDNERNSTEQSLFTLFFKYFKSDIFFLSLAIPSAILSAYFNIRINLALGDLVNEIQKSYQSPQSAESFSEGLWKFLSVVKEPSLKLLLNYSLQSFFNFSYLFSIFMLSERTANRIRNDLFTKFIGLELSYFDLHNRGDIINCVTNDVQEFKSSFKQVVSLGIKNVAQISGSLYALYNISPDLMLVNMTIPVMSLLGTILGNHLRSLSKQIQDQLGRISDIVIESVNNIRTVKMLSIENILEEKFSQELEAYNDIHQEFSLNFAILQSLSSFSFNIIVLATLLKGGSKVFYGEMSPGELMSFLATTQSIQRSFYQLSLLASHYIKFVSSLSRIRDYLSIPSPTFPSGTIVDFNGRIEFKNVFFRYPLRKDTVVLKDVNLTLEPGTVTALCGSSGSGKSTIAMLLSNLYFFESGSIKLDGFDIRLIDPIWLRREIIGYISQEPILFCTSIMENIRFGNPKATDEEIYEAAKLANAHEFISQFPEGYNTIVGQQGTALSGGQRQRIAIARAIVKNPKILILDEATSALDTQSEALIKEALDNVMKNRTVLVIAHRMSTIQNADKIVVVHRGRICEQGTHSELLAKKGKYFELINSSSDSNDV